MSTHSRFSRLACTLLCLGLPLLAGSDEGGLEFGTSLKIQRPLGEYQSTVLDAGLGYGLGLRARYGLNSHHGLAARLDTDWFPEGKAEAYGPNYLMEQSIQVREMALGLNYEWMYSGGNKGGYLLVGPVYRRWQDERSSSYVQTDTGSVPAAHTTKTTPSGLGLDVGWGYRGTTGSVLEIHVVTSKYGDTGYTANALQFTLVQVLVKSGPHRP